MKKTHADAVVELIELARIWGFEDGDLAGNSDAPDRDIYFSEDEYDEAVSEYVYDYFDYHLSNLLELLRTEDLQDEIDRRAEKSAEQWERMKSPYTG